jgi:nucleoside-diphosphate-sugar epimerase
LDGLVTVKTIAVLGATGYLGTAVCESIETRGWRAIKCDREGAATSWSELSRESVDAVVNCVGAGMNADDNPPAMSLLDANLLVPLAAARFALRSGARLVHIGSAAQRSERLRVESPYVSSKQLASDALRLIAETDGLRVTELKPHVVYGGKNSPGVVGAMVGSIVEGKPFPLRTPEVRRDFVHKKDVSRAVISAIETPEQPWISVEIGSGDGFMLNEVAEMIGGLTGTINAWTRDPGVGRPWVGDLIADPTDAEETLGFRARISLQEGLQVAVSDAQKELAS